MSSSFAPYRFIGWMVVVLLLAVWFPSWGGGSHALPLDLLQRAGVFLIFFNQGILLPREAVRRGVVDPRLHIGVQVCTFWVFPLMTMALMGAMPRGLLPVELRHGFWYLSILPTTITSAVIFTAGAGGNVTGALFNAVLSSALGLLLVPVVSMFLLCAGQGDAILPPPSLLGNLVWMILLPFGLGHLLQRPLGAVWQQRKSWVTGLNHAVILFIVWRAFSQSILLETWSEVTTNQFLAVLTGVLILLLVMTAVAWWGSGMIRLDAASRVTALFCGSQKTLALGLPMAGILFEDLPVDLSMLVFPLLLYHPLQLLLAGLLTSPLKQWVIENSETSYEKFPPHRFSSG